MCSKHGGAKHQPAKLRLSARPFDKNAILAEKGGLSLQKIISLACLQKYHATAAQGLVPSLEQIYPFCRLSKHQ